MARRDISYSPASIDNVIKLWELTYIRFARLNLIQNYPASYFEVWARQRPDEFTHIKMQVKLITQPAKRAEAFFRLAGVNNDQNKEPVSFLKLALETLYSLPTEEQVKLLSFFFSKADYFEISPKLLGEMQYHIPYLISKDNTFSSIWLKTVLGMPEPDYAFVDKIFANDPVRRILIQIYRIYRLFINSNDIQPNELKDHLQTIENELLNISEASLTLVQEQDFNFAIGLISL